MSTNTNSQGGSKRPEGEHAVLTVVPVKSDVPFAVRLKNMLRSYGLRLVHFDGKIGDSPPTASGNAAEARQAAPDQQEIDRP